LAMVGYPLPEIRIGTNDDGTFAITNVPSGVDWYLYGKMESLSTLGGSPIVECTSKGDGEELDIGDVSLLPAFRLRGRVLLSNKNTVPAGMRITISSEKVTDSQTVILGADGAAFEFSGLAKGMYSIFASVRGYRMPSNSIGGIPLMVEKNIDDWLIT